MVGCNFTQQYACGVKIVIMTDLNDIAKVVRKIESTGLSHEQAEAIVNAIAEAWDQVSTKSDIAALKDYIRYQVLIGAGIVIASLKALEYLGL